MMQFFSRVRQLQRRPVCTWIQELYEMTGSYFYCHAVVRTVSYWGNIVFCLLMVRAVNSFNALNATLVQVDDIYSSDRHIKRQKIY